MLLRISLWAMLIGSIIMGYLGYQTGSALTTFVGMVAIVFIVFLLFFLAKMTLTAGLTFAKVIVIVLLIGGAIFLCVRGCTVLWQKGQTAIQTTAESFKKNNEETDDITENDEMYPSLWQKVKNVFTPSANNQILPPSKITTDQITTDKAVSMYPKQLTGTVSRVLSGTTFIIDNITLKLYGIDAPDMLQTCLSKRNETYPCGRTVKKKLEKLLLNKQIECQLMVPYAPSKYYAVCVIKGYDVGATMVSVGWAIADRKISEVYIPYENQARQKNEGLWSGKFVAPWEYRKNKMQHNIIREEKGFFKGLFE